MGKSIKRAVIIRVACALLSVLLFIVVIIVNLASIQGALEARTAANNLMGSVEQAEVAHYKWSSNLSNALYAGTEFTGSMDPKTCALGKWVYGDLGTDDQEIKALRDKIEPLHKELHSSASYVLGMLAESPEEAQGYYQETIQRNLATLVGYMDQVVERTTAISEETRLEVNQIGRAHV